MTKCDYLFLLVGRNPLPNYVVTHHLMGEGEAGQVVLLYSGHTQPLGELLQKRLIEDFKVKTEIREIPAVGSGAIKKRITDIVRSLAIPKDAIVNLNYTGGTKPMAVHVYRALESAFDNQITFSYLNAQDLYLYTDNGPDEGSQFTNNTSNATCLHLSLAKLAALHGYDVIVDGNARKEPTNLDLATAVCHINQNETGQAAWLKWRQEEFLQDKLPDPNIYQPLREFTNTLEKLCEGSPTPEKVAQLLGHKQLNQCGKWFNSDWLEDVVLATVQSLKSRINFTDDQIMAGLKLKPQADLKLKDSRDFESDVLIVKGFQVFLISCIANSNQKPQETKKHLFEAYVRARQLGGDEARTAVVCLLNNSDAVEMEIKRDWLPVGGIRVFGRDHLDKLATHLNRWIAQA
ncbi:MAG: DUF1887 family protein [Ardenticatenaceae bacterium]|nr:DUF1887 family protein [Ardenticatenaceae bacterium]